MESTNGANPSESEGRDEFPLSEKAEGPISAAVIAAGVGATALGVVTTLAEAGTGVKDALAWSDSVGPLSGKSTLAVAVWLLAWVVLHTALRDKPYETVRALGVSLVLIALGVLGTFPEFFQIFG
ncbi:hypothetical protein [Streptomyces vilmorinianum]|uniref:hypothetical protein n=1 Tax=Streptomyces vilmorinianum TaxID=3051092 RepID=UPI0010FBA33D|nr:hypothetical protein [Streptomyces vilmorinianum]